jgi:nucleoside-diphosphate-sugar epimerase
MRIVVTGGSGLAGQHIVDDLLDHGLDVVSLDIRAPAERQGEFRQVDLTDYAGVEDAVKGADAIVHMGGIPRPGSDTNADLFRTNLTSTFNVFEAAASHGVSRVVLASSISVLGYPFHYRPFAPDFVPIDETHPLQPQDPYALTKAIGEQIAEGFVRRTEMTVISLRLAWIHTPETFKEQLQPMWDDPAAGASNLWGYIDVRDVAKACRLALTVPLSGHHACFVAAPDTFMNRPTAELVRKFYPKTTIRPSLEGRVSLISSQHANRLLGFRARYTWEAYNL